MSKSWKPTGAGKLFTSSPDWLLKIDASEFSLSGEKLSISGSILELTRLIIKPGVIWSSLRFPGENGENHVVDGLPNSDAKELSEVVSLGIKNELIRDFKKGIAPILLWSTSTVAATKEQLLKRGWLTGEFIARQIASKPTFLIDILSSPELIAHIEGETPEVKEGVNFWKKDFQQFADNVNERHLKKQLTDCKDFFATVEKSPLTLEQSKAVICFDNRVLLIASAGSGKTSTMVAKAGYALKNGYCSPERMLLLAFNTDASKELSQRIKDRLEPLGLEADKVVAKTFHAFGLDVIGQSTGKRPSLASWVANGRDLEHLLGIVDDLKDKNPEFRTNWDMFRVVFGEDLPEFGKETESSKTEVQEQKDGVFWTLNNETVKSRGEKLIADWLFYNGIRYQYEPAFEIDTATAQYRQYTPDFYLIDAKSYLEHWALDEHGEPPPEFENYKEGMIWKKQLHTEHGTTLLETTTAGLWSGQAFRYLEVELTKLGLTLDPNPDRPVVGRKPIENPRLAGTFRSFMTHAKNNRLSLSELQERLNNGIAGRFSFRHQHFLDLFKSIFSEWERRLQQEKAIDFEDMLNMAIDHVESGRWKSPYELVMVDEFQDASHARARLVAALVKEPDRHLFAVGDDWQSINRFAGADLAVMTDFEKRFGQTVTLKLETTFRCPQSLCDISSSFIQRNPKQLRKEVRSYRPNISAPVKAVCVGDETEIRFVIENQLDEIAKTTKPNSKQKVLLLGRYQKDKDYAPLNFDHQRLDVQFITAHASKGLEADHVIVPKMTSETLGFPSRVADDPVMQLAMPAGDAFEFAEERRLFYVALTRAKSTVTLITVRNKRSAFVTELVEQHKIKLVNTDGSINTDQLCPVCGNGFLLEREGKFGRFIGCSSFPKCRHTRKLTTRAAQAQSFLR